VKQPAPRRRRLAEILVDRREALGLSRKELAYRSGLSYPYVSQLESGDREPSMDGLAKLAGALETDVSELVTGLSIAEPESAALAAMPARAELMATDSWLANPSYAAPAAPAARSARMARTASARESSRPADRERAVEAAYRALAALTPAQRLDAAGVLLARCLRDAAPEAP
jgi:transcriptional regulator with XRE-family HTH domain